MPSIAAKTAAVSQRRTPKRQVPGQALGYSVQFTRAVIRLLDSPAGASVTFEKIDDIGVVTTAGQTTAEQSKSVVSTHNPLADRAVAWWKTLASWVEAVAEQELRVDSTEFVLFVSRNVRGGDIFGPIESATTIAAGQSALEHAKKALLGDATDLKGARLSKALRPFVETVFNADEDLVAKIVAKVSVIRGGGSATASVEESLKRALVPVDLIRDVRDHAIGWVKRTIDEQLERGTGATVAVDEFRAELTAYIRRHDQRTVLVSAARVSTAEAEAEASAARPYLRQLDFIGFDFDAKVKEARRFLSAAADRSNWATRGYVHAESFTELEDTLVHQWENKRRIRLLEDRARAETDTGALIFSDCSMHNATLQGLDVPPHFVPGSYHALSDSRRVGWHPRFEALLTSTPDADAQS